VCIAIDESGSVCTSKGSPGGPRPPPQLCQNPRPVPFPPVPVELCFFASSCCDYFGSPTLVGDIECPLFNNATKNFTKDFIDELTDAIEPDNGPVRFSVVEFATNSEVTSPLTTPDDAKAAVLGIDYTGGWTNTEQAIRNCTETLKGSTADIKFMLLLTDGSPTAIGEFATGRADGCDANGGPVGSPCRNAAVAAATAAKDAGIKLATVLVSTVSTDGDFLKDHISSSEDLFFPAPDFGSLQGLVDDIVEEVNPCEK